MTRIHPRNAVKGLIGAAMMMPALGCTSNRVNLGREGIVKVTLADCHPVTVSARVEQDGDETIISGTITRRPPLSPGNVHIDVTLTTPGGEVIAAGTALAYPRSVAYRGNRARRFAIWFPFVPPRGSLVHLVCDAKLHPPGKFSPATGKGMDPG